LAHPFCLWPSAPSHMTIPHLLDDFRLRRYTCQPYKNSKALTQSFDTNSL
jgi:hypothetical protein